MEELKKEAEYRKKKDAEDKAKAEQDAKDRREFLEAVYEETGEMPDELK